ncbi:hypothetical protein [Ammoniphilus sp. 3BR4]|uniref:hypothetical protein n=1 Tax=Ammoniphilus sp. 3BR4 TaxID=3158265 RepID=UPI003464F254
MNSLSFQSYFPDLDEQLQDLYKDYLKLWEQVQRIKEEEKSRVQTLPTVKLVTYYRQKAEKSEVTP